MQTERCGLQVKLSCVEKAGEGPNKLEDHLVNVEHKKRPRVARELRNLPRGFRVVAHRGTVLWIMLMPHSGRRLEAARAAPASPHRATCLLPRQTATASVREPG